jgi:hypothetical protein
LVVASQHFNPVGASHLPATPRGFLFVKKGIIYSQLLTITFVAPRKGNKIFHNPQTRQALMFSEDPGPPWIKGRPPWQDLTQTPEHIAKRAESMRKRVREQGPTPAEVEGYQKLSETRKQKKIRHTPEICFQISEKLRGRPQVWQENKSRASCRRCCCDTVYVLLVTTKDGEQFGKWGSTKEESFQFREKEFRRKGFTWKLLFWQFFGEVTEDAEATLGRTLSQHPWEHTTHFFGHTETFEWSEKTQQLLEETINALEESAPSKGDW